MKDNKRLQWFGSIIVGGVLLCYWGLYNGYPFAYPDTGAYIFMGFNGNVPTDRPLSYGLFIRHTSMADSLFWVIYAQGMLTSLTIWFILRHYLPTVGPSFFIGLILTLVACTNISIYVSYLIPDLFTAVFLANFGLLLFADLTPKRRWMVGVLSWIALIMHNSHLFEGLILVVLFAVVRLFPRFRRVIPVKRLLTAGAIVLLGWLSVPGIHWMYSGKFSMQQAAPVFAMARVNEMCL